MSSSASAAAASPSAATRKNSKNSSLKRASPNTSNSTSITETQSSSQSSLWSAPFSTISQRLIQLFITVLVIARIKSKPASNAQGDKETDPKKHKKQVRIDIVGDVEQPNTDDTKGSFRSLQEERGDDDDAIRVNLDDSRFREEEKSGYERHKATMCKVFVAASVGSIAILLYAFFSK
jgi:hypothetical protein